MNKIRVYIAGKVKGSPIDVVKAKFQRAEKEIKSMNAIPYNPVKTISFNNRLRNKLQLPQLSDEIPADRNIIMKMCIKKLAVCDAIYLCHDWQDSKGANIEKQVADLLNIPIFHAQQLHGLKSYRDV